MGTRNETLVPVLRTGSRCLPEVVASSGPDDRCGQMDTRLWTFDDIKDAMARYETYRNTSNPMRHYYYGLALEVAGQCEEADEKYLAFRVEAERSFGSLDRGAAHFEAEADALLGDDRLIEHYLRMANVLQGPNTSDAAKRERTCIVG